MTQVVAALIWQDEKFMICQRPPHKARGLLWEFVGGKVEAGESKQQALVRECREELNLLVDVHDVFMQVLHEYPDISIELTLFNCTILSGELMLNEHKAMQWISPMQIEDFDFCPADKEILKEIKLKFKREEL